MSTETERLSKRIAFLEAKIENQNDSLDEVGIQLKRLEQPKPDQVTCSECGSRHTKSKPCTAILPDRAVEYICTHCKHSWRVNIKGGYLPGQVYRIAYKTVAEAKPTFIHVRAESPTRALMAFIDGTSPLQVSAVKLDNEYDGPLLNERENFWPANDAKVTVQEDTGDNDEDDI